MDFQANSVNGLHNLWTYRYGVVKALAGIAIFASVNPPPILSMWLIIMQTSETKSYVKEIDDMNINFSSSKKKKRYSCVRPATIMFQAAVTDRFQESAIGFIDTTGLLLHFRLRMDIDKQYATTIVFGA